MTLREYSVILRSSWLLILSTLLIGVLAALGLSLAQTPLYQAESQLFVSVQGASGPEALASGYYVQQRMQSYVAVVDTPGVLDPVVTQLGLDGTPSVTAQSPPNTVLLDVVASDPDPAIAAKVADATAASLAKEIVRLETTDRGAKPVQAELIRPAQVPVTPVAPRTKFNLAFGALLGLLVGVGIAILRATLDTSIKSVGDLVNATQTNVLGSIAYDSGAAKNPLITLGNSARAEAFRSVRTNLQFVNVDKPPQVVVITSALAGEGKTTSACNLAITMAQGGQAVALVECDLRRPRVASYLEISNAVGLTNVLTGQVRLEHAVVPWNRGMLTVLPSGPLPPNPSELLGSLQMVALLDELRTRFDAIILDAPPLLPVTDGAVVSRAADGVLMVVRHGSTTTDQLSRATKLLEQGGGTLLGAVVNFVPVPKRGGKGDYYGYYASTGYAPEAERRPTTTP